MKNFIKIISFILLVNIAAKAKAGNKLENPIGPSNEIETNTNDSTTGIKSNIIIFQIITPPAPAPANNQNGSLKNAGKVARTSYSHTSIENILLKTKGI